MRLTESSLIINFALKNPKMGFLEDLGGRGEDIWWEPLRNATTADLRRLVKKIADLL